MQRLKRLCGSYIASHVITAEICRCRGQRLLRLLDKILQRTSTAKQEVDISRGQPATSYRLHPRPCVCDQDAPVTLQEQQTTVGGK